MIWVEIRKLIRIDTCHLIRSHRSKLCGSLRVARLEDKCSTLIWIKRLSRAPVGVERRCSPNWIKWRGSCVWIKWRAARNCVLRCVRIDITTTTTTTTTTNDWSSHRGERVLTGSHSSRSCIARTIFKCSSVNEQKICSGKIEVACGIYTLNNPSTRRRHCRRWNCKCLDRCRTGINSGAQSDCFGRDSRNRFRESNLNISCDIEICHSVRRIRLSE